jgi:CDGSH-type Zn-finger protein
MERSPQDKGLFEKSALCCGEDPHRQYCELQTERANDRTADDPARNAACEKNEFHEMPPEVKMGAPLP